MVDVTNFSRAEFNRAVQAISHAMNRALDKADAAFAAGDAAKGNAYVDAFDALEDQLNRIFDMRDEYFRSDRNRGQAEARLAAGAAEAERLLRRLRSAQSFLEAAAKIAEEVTGVVAFLRGAT